MRYSVNIPNLGDFADPRVVADTARLAEESGWDGLFIWDHLIGYNRDLVADFAATSILLAAAALATSRIRLGTQVIPATPIDITDRSCQLLLAWCLACTTPTLPRWPRLLRRSSVCCL